MNVVIVGLLALVSVPINQMTPDAVDTYLLSLQRDMPSYVDRLDRVVHDSIGTPYHDGPLGEGPDGGYDKDPLIDLSRADCVTFVEQSVALAIGISLDDTTRKLQQIRYSGGKVDFATRNHFMIADWIPNNPWCEDVTTQLGVPVESLTRTISKAAFFRLVKAPEVGQDVPDRDVTINYIPINSAAEAVKHIQKPSVVVFVGKIDWLFALHCGIYLPDAQGGGALYHASSKAGAVAAMDLAAYATEQSSRYLGFTVYEIGQPTFSPAEP